MAAIVPVAMDGVGTLKILRQAVTTSQTDWVPVPRWPRVIIVHLSITTFVANLTPTFQSADPVLRDDGQALNLFAPVALSAVGNHDYYIAPDATLAPFVIADTDLAGGDARVRIGGGIPALLGVGIASGGSTYTVSVEFAK